VSLLKNAVIFVGLYFLIITAVTRCNCCS